MTCLKSDRLKSNTDISPCREEFKSKQRSLSSISSLLSLSLSLCVCVCVYIYIYIYTHTYIYSYTYIQTHIHTRKLLLRKEKKRLAVSGGSKQLEDDGCATIRENASRRL
jgi:hypothetical protein